jgi:hypothetical protein
MHWDGVVIQSIAVAKPLHDGSPCPVVSRRDRPNVPAEILHGRDDHAVSQQDARRDLNGD